VTSKIVYPGHIGLPVNDIKRAEKFYVDVLGMTVMGRGSGVRDNNRPFYEMLGYWPEVLRLACSKDNRVEVVLLSAASPSSGIGMKTVFATRGCRRAAKISTGR
jgi:catechol 2,3-dioxygenase-like lactoylglutathione lyase family enzyme